MEHGNISEDLSYSSKKVHYADFPEQQDNAMEGENFSEISKSSAKIMGDGNSEISIGTSILDVEDQEVKSLRKKVEECEYKMRFLELENQQVNADLINERVRTSKLEKKLQFVKDNQEVFMRLKEAYINMKYNEAAGRKMIEIREKSVQTWQGMLCSSCIESEELRRQIDLMIQKYSELFVVTPSEMERLVNTVKYLKDLISRREETWLLNVDREQKMQNHIALLEHENMSLKDLLSKRDMNVDEVTRTLLMDEKLEKTLLDERKVEEMQKFVESVTKDMEKLKRIIIKYDRKFSELKERYPTRMITPLNEKEIKIVQQIVSKFAAKIQKTRADRAAECRSLSADRIVIPQSHRPSSPVKTSQRNRDSPRSRPKTPSPDRLKPVKAYDQKADSAILMMDYLFD